MGGFLLIACRAGLVILSFVLSVLVIKTFEYFNRLQMHDTHRPLLAWDVLMLFCMLAYLVVMLITR